MSTYYNKSNLKVKESSEQFWIEMSISNGVCKENPEFIVEYGDTHKAIFKLRWHLIQLKKDLEYK